MCFSIMGMKHYADIIASVVFAHNGSSDLKINKNKCIIVGIIIKMWVRVKCRLGHILFPRCVKNFYFIATHLYMVTAH